VRLDHLLSRSIVFWSVPRSLSSFEGANAPSRGFICPHLENCTSQLRKNEQLVDALAHRADEGRRKPAIVPGELQSNIDPGVSEWGNPSHAGGRLLSESIGQEGESREVKHLSTSKNRKHKRFR
jgi:hypothetical protein